MKKLVLLLTAITALLGYSPSYALDGAGTVEQIRICTRIDGLQDNPWTRIGLFKLSDGNWFGVYMNHTQSTATDYDDNTIYSLALLAFTANYQVNVRANYTTHTACGIQATFLWSAEGDYIELLK